MERSRGASGWVDDCYYIQGSLPGSAGFVPRSHTKGVSGLLGLGVKGCAVELLDPLDPLLESLNDLVIPSGKSIGECAGGV
jgi:hypothetical protein